LTSRNFDEQEGTSTSRNLDVEQELRQAGTNEHALGKHVLKLEQEFDK
jgi:hypothetical protein